MEIVNNLNLTDHMNIEKVFNHNNEKIEKDMKQKKTTHYLFYNKILFHFFNEYDYLNTGRRRGTTICNT